jgi:hypothetical protein
LDCSAQGNPNVAGNIVAMKQLIDMLVGLDCQIVKTYIKAAIFIATLRVK